MFFSTRGGKRGLPVSAVVVAALCATACSSNGPLDDDQASSEARSAEAGAIENLVLRYWDAVVTSENTVDPDPARFAELAEGPFIERHLKTVRDYEESGIRRVGEPEITEIEVAVSGDQAEVEACLNEDAWTAEQDGTTLKAPKLGPVPWGAVAERHDDEWVLTDVRVPPEGAKDC